jgi:hypothetical protein
MTHISDTGVSSRAIFEIIFQISNFQILRFET